MEPNVIRDIRDFFAKKGMLGGVELVDFLVLPENQDIAILSTATIGMAKIDKADYVTEADIINVTMALPSLRFGTMSGKRMPLQDIAELVAKVDDPAMNPEVLVQLDEVFSDLVMVAKGEQDKGLKSIGSAMVVRKGGPQQKPQ